MTPTNSTKSRKPAARMRANASETPRPTIAFRVRADVYEKLRASAEARGFSLSEEIEHRLNRSLDTAGDHFAELALQLIADNWRAVQSLSGRKMVEDKFTLQACCEAAYRATELLAGVNGMDLKVGLFDSLGPEGTSIEAGKQLGQAIVYHRELLHMKDPPQWATSVYEANVIDALTKRISVLQAKAAERAVTDDQSEPTPAQDKAPEPQPKVKPTPKGTRWATSDEVAGMVETPGQLPESIGGQATFDDAVSGLPLVKAEKAAAAERRAKAPLDVGAGSPDVAGKPKGWKPRLGLREAAAKAKADAKG